MNFITGSGADNLTIKHAAQTDTVNINSAGGTDTVNIGGGKAWGIGGIVGNKFGNYPSTVFNISNTPSYTHLVVDYSNETSYAAVTVDGWNGDGHVNTTTDPGYYYGKVLNSIIYKDADVSDITVKHGDGIAVCVKSTQIPTNLVGNSYNGYVTLGGWGWEWDVDDQQDPDLGYMGDIVAPLSISNPTGYTDIRINDGYDASARFVQMNSQSITGLGSGSITWVGADISNIDVWMPEVAACGFNFNSTVAPTTVHTADSVVSSVVVGNNGSVQQILGAATIDPGWGSTTNIIVDDSSDPTARTATLDQTLLPQGNWSYIHSTLTGLAPAAINWRLTNTPATINGGSGGNTFIVKNVAADPNGGVGYNASTINLNTGSGNDTVNVKASGVGTTLNIEGQSGLDTVNVGNAGNAQGVQGTVNISNTGQYTTLTVDDSFDPVSRTVTLDTLALLGNHPWGTITGIVPGTINYRAYDIKDPLTIKCGSGGNNVTVNNTPLKTVGVNVGNTINLNTGTSLDHVTVAAISPGTKLTVDGQAGNDQVTVGFNGSVQSIFGTVTVKNTTNYSELTIDDSLDSVNRIVTLGVLPAAGNPQGTITGLAPGVINFVASDVSNPTINGGSGANTYTVIGTPTSYLNGNTGPAITLNAGAGADIVNVQGMGIGTELDVNGQANDDAVTVNYNIGVPLNSMIVVDGGTAGAIGDSLKVKGAQSDTFSMTAGHVDRGALGHLSYSNVNTLYCDTGAFNASNDLNLGALVAQSAQTSIYFGSSQTIGKLVVDAAYVWTAPGGAISLNVNGLNVANNGKLDLADNQMLISYGNGPDPISTIRGYLQSGYNGGNWNGSGIMSWTAQTDASKRTAIGYADSADGTGANSTPNSIKLLYTLYGDANLDKKVDTIDFNFLAANFSGTGKSWSQGDFNYGATVDTIDFNLLASNFSQALPANAVNVMNSARSVFSSRAILAD